MLREPRKQRLFGQLLPQRLGHAEVDHLHHRRGVMHHDQHIGRLDVAVNDSLLVRVLDGVAKVGEQLQALAGGELVLIAKLGDGHALDQLHHEVGAAGVGGARVKNLGDVGVIHERQRLPLGLEARQHLTAVHPRLEELQCHLAAHRLLLLGHEDHAKPALADLLQQAVTPDHHPWAFVQRGDRFQRTLRARQPKHVPGVVMGRQ